MSGRFLFVLGSLVHRLPRTNTGPNTLRQQNLDWAIIGSVWAGNRPPAPAAARRPNVELWDLWFLAWGILLTLATVSYWKRTAKVP